MTGRPVAAALAGGLLSLSPLTTVAAAGPVNQSPVAIAVSQNGVGINVCQTSCTQSVQVLNIAVVTVVVGGGPARRPVVALRPAALRFGGAVVGHAGSPRSVTVVETAGVPALITGMHLTGPAAGDFQLAPSSCLQTRVPVTVLAPRGRCAVVATFTPSAPGNRVAGLVMSVDGAPRSAALSGTGVAPVAVAHAAPAAVRAPQPPVSRGAPARAPAVRSAATRSPARARASRTAAVTPRLAVPVAPVAAPPA